MFLAALLTVAVTAKPIQAQPIFRHDLQRHDLSIKGWEELQVRVNFEPHALAAMHKYPGEEIIDVLKGTIQYRLQGLASVTLKTGDTLLVPYGVAHSAAEAGGSAASELATYILEKRKPLIVPVP